MFDIGLNKAERAFEDLPKKWQMAVLYVVETIDSTAIAMIMNQMNWKWAGHQPSMHDVRDWAFVMAVELVQEFIEAQEDGLIKNKFIRSSGGIRVELNLEGDEWVFSTTFEIHQNYLYLRDMDIDN